MFERFSVGLELAKQSFSVLRERKSLLLFPLLSGIACLALLAAFLIPMLREGGGAPALEGESMSASFYIWTALYYFATSFVVVFFNTAIAECAIMHFRGQHPTLRDGLRGAMSRLPQIAKWAALAATVGLILRAIEERSGALGRFVVGLFGMAWSAATFFVVPVLVMERLGPIDAAKRSVELIKGRWAESLSANLGIGFVAAILYFLFGAVCAIGFVQFSAGASALGGMLLAVGLGGIVIVALASTAMSTIATSAIYLYAGGGDVPREFSQHTLERVFSSRR